MERVKSFTSGGRMDGQSGSRVTAGHGFLAKISQLLVLACRCRLQHALQTTVEMHVTVTGGLGRAGGKTQSWPAELGSAIVSQGRRSRWTGLHDCSSQVSQADVRATEAWWCMRATRRLGRHPRRASGSPALVQPRAQSRVFLDVGSLEGR